MPLENKYSTCMNPLLDSYNVLKNPPAPYQDNPNSAPAPGRSVLVFADSYGFAANVLKYAPQDRISRKQIITTKPGQLSKEKLTKILSETWDMLIYAYPIDEPKDNTSEEIHKTQTDVFKLLLEISKIIFEDADLVKNVCILTCDAMSEDREIHEQCGVGLVTNAGMYGYHNTAKMETQGVPWQLIDVEWSLPETMMPMLSSEVFRKETFGRGAVRILKSGRYVQKTIDPTTTYTEANNEIDIPKEGGTVAISGGNGGVALIIGDWIVREAGRKGVQNLNILFLSRSMKISDENQQFWQVCQDNAAKYGVTVKQAKGDISDQAVVDEFCKEHANDLIGFVHSAGVLRDAPIFKVDWPMFEQVWNPKSRAALWLHEGFEKYGCPIHFFFMFSSVAIYGSPAQLNYSASNSFMDGLARHRRALGKPALTLQWGPWGETGMALTIPDKDKKKMAEGPMPPFTNKQGLSGLETLISTNVANGSVYICNPTAMWGWVATDNMVAKPFYSHELSPMPTHDFTQVKLDQSNVYMTYRELAGFKFNERKGLVYKAYVQPVVDPDGDMEEDY